MTTIVQQEQRHSQIVQPRLPYKQISSITFQSLSSTQIRKMSHIQLVNKDMYIDNKPVEYSVLDPRLGTSMKKEKCATCGLSILECVGHWYVFEFLFQYFDVESYRYILKHFYSILKHFYSNLKHFKSF